MDLEEVTSKIDEEIKNGELMLQAVFNRNIQAIEVLKKEGYSYKTIHSKLACEINIRHFRSLISIARKSDNLNKKNESGKISTNDENLKEIVPLTKENKKPQQELDLWIKVFNFSQPVKKTTALDGIIQTLSEAGWNFDNYSILRDEKSITTMSKLIDTVSFIRSSKFKKNIIKDNKPCF